VLKAEEERFGETLENGMKILEAQLAKDPQNLDGATAFTLYDTYGFPLDLTADICRERNITLDEAGFDRRAWKAEEDRARRRQVQDGRQGRIRGREEQVRRLRQRWCTTATSSRCTPTA
jgi:alanyl-tRNA synthetase